MKPGVSGFFPETFFGFKARHSRMGGFSAWLFHLKTGISFFKPITYHLMQAENKS